MSDETEVFNFGFDVIRPVLDFEIGETHPSAWTHYTENKYKLIGLQINVKDSRTKTARETYGLLELVGDIGGVFEFVYLIGSLLTKGAVTYNYIALIAHSMYI